MGLDPVTKFFIKLAISLYSYNQQRKAQKKAERAARASRSNVLVNKQSNSDPIYALYGKQRMGGTRVYVESSDGAGTITDKTTKLNMVLAMCEGEIGTVKVLYFNETIVWDVDDGGTLTANGNGGYTLAGFTSKYANYIICNWYPGTTTQTVDTAMQTSVNSTTAVDATTIQKDKSYKIVTVGTTDYTTVGSPNNTVGTVFLATDTPTGDGTVNLTPWTDAHRLQGVCYFAMQLEANGEAFGGQLPVMTMILEGKKILDVSTLVNGDVIGDMTAGNYTTSSNQNPANILYDYLISDIYGKGLDRDANGNWVAGTNVNLASFQQAKIDCDAARSAAGYPLNGFLQTERQLFDNVGEIMETCNGMMLFVDGQYQFRIRKKNEEVGIPTSAIFDKNTIIGVIRLGLPDKSRKLNKAQGNFNNPNTNYNDDIVIYNNPAYAIEDNGSILEATEDYTMITDSTLVTDLITQTVDISRNEQTVQFEAAHTALLLKSGDIIEVVSSELGWGPDESPANRKYFRVQELTLTEENTVDITATTYNSAEEL